MRALAALLLLLVLPGCATGIAAAGKAAEVAEIRIGRQTTYNNAKLQGCLQIADELRRLVINEIEARNLDSIEAFLVRYNQQMATCKPALLIEEVRNLREGGQ